jgi:ribosomal protein S18 acetylase RimI-like enzyme
MNIRLLGPADAAVLTDVDDAVFDHEVSPALAAEFLEDPRHHIVVAIEADRVVGMATGVHYVHPDKPPELFINEVAVDPSHRRRGIARAMLGVLLGHARTLGCRAAWVLAEPGNEAAQRLYGEKMQGTAEPATMFTFPID